MVTQHQKDMSEAYREANIRLRRTNIDEFHQILETVYAERGLVIKKRLTGERLAAKKVNDARDILSNLTSNAGNANIA